jgi:hypothetical protein
VRSGAGGFLLLLIGALGLIGFLTGNLDRWLAFLFSPGTPTSATGTPASSPPVATASAPASANQRGSIA